MSLEKSKVEEPIANTNNRYEDLLNLKDIFELNPKVNIGKYDDKTKIIIDNLSNRDFKKLNKYKNRVEEYVTNRYLDKIEDIDSTQEVIEKYENIKYFKKQPDEDIDFLMVMEENNFNSNANRIINVTRIKNETKIQFCKLLEPIPPEVEKKDLLFLNHLKSGTVSTFSKIKNSFGKLVPSFDFRKNKDEISTVNEEPEKESIQEVEETPMNSKRRKQPRKRTLKNHYTYHQLPGQRPLKNSTIKITKKRLKLQEKNKLNLNLNRKIVNLKIVNPKLKNQKNDKLKKPKKPKKSKENKLVKKSRKKS